MRIANFGDGPPVVVIPGIQGRWEWMRPGLEALAADCRVITFSLADEPTCGGRFEAARGFDGYVEQVADALDAARVSQAAICGVSYGGLIAGAFAARNPQRVSSLVIVSPLPPSWTPDERVRFYLRAPRLLSPLFMLQSVRLYREMSAAAGGTRPALGMAARHGYTVLTHMPSPARMARRVRLLDGLGLADELRPVRVPTLLVTGSPLLERVVPVATSREYLDLWPHARFATIDRTGHLGIITRPDAFAAIVAPFVKTGGESCGTWRRVV